MTTPLTDAIPIPQSHNVATAAALGGTPLSIVSVLLYENYTHTKLDAVSAAAIGSCGAAFFGYLWHIMTVVVEHYLSELKRNKP